MKARTSKALTVGLVSLVIGAAGAKYLSTSLEEARQTGYSQGYKIGVEETTYEMLGEEKVTPSLTARNSEDHTDYWRFDVLLNGRSKEEVKQGRMPTSDIIVMSDFRKIEEGEFSLNDQMYKNMVHDCTVPAYIFMTEKTRQRIENDSTLRKIVDSYISPLYKRTIIDEETFRKTDPWTYIVNKDSPQGVYSAPQIVSKEEVKENSK